MIYMKKRFIEGEILKGYEVLQYAMDMHYPVWDTLGREESDIPKRIDEDSDYILKKFNINLIEEPIFRSDDEKIKEYMELDINTIPPIVLEFVDNSYYIVDGCHRYSVAKKLCKESILAYIPII